MHPGEPEKWGALFAFIQDFLETFCEYRIHDFASPASRAIPKRKPGKVDDIEKQLACRLEPFVELVADFDGYGATMPEHPQREDKVERLWGEVSQINIFPK